MLRKILCFFGVHTPRDHRIDGSHYEYDMVCQKCTHCGKQLTWYEPR